MTDIYREKITDGTAWKGGDFSKDDISFWLTKGNDAALREVDERLAAKDRDTINRTDTGHPNLDRDLARIYDEVIHGRGLVVVRGFPVDGSIEEVERRYWIFCTHFGELLSMNCFGDRMVRVQEEVLPGGVQPARGTKSSAELAMHNDGGDLFALLCVHQAKEGGESQFASGPAAHNTILESRADLLPILYRGFPYHRRGEQADGEPDVTPFDVPLFSNVDGRVSINFVLSGIIPAIHVLGRKLTDEESEALDLLRDTLVRQQVTIRCEAGDIVIANNFAMCHSRSDYVDGDVPSERRLLLRAWMEVTPGDRRLPKGREYWYYDNEGGRLGVDPVPGRDNMLARNEHKNVEGSLADLFKESQKKPVGGM